MQTFSDLRRSFFDNPFVIIFSSLGMIIASGFLSAHFVVLVFCGFSYLAFMHYVRVQWLTMTIWVLLLQVYIASILGLWTFSILLYFIGHYIFIKKLLAHFTLPEKFYYLIHVSLFYFFGTITLYFFEGLDWHLLWIVFYNILFDILLVLVFL